MEYYESQKISQDIEKTIFSIQENIKNKNYNYISSQIANLNTLILNYLLALDYEIRNLDIKDEKLKNIKEIINLNLQKITEYLKTKDENLIIDVQNSLTQIYNTIFQPQNLETTNWTDTEEQTFFQLLSQISTLSNKVYQYYQRKNAGNISTKEELKEIAINIQKLIEKIP